jgi:hypothetical protein
MKSKSLSWLALILVSLGILAVTVSSSKAEDVVKRPKPSTPPPPPVGSQLVR